MSNDVYDAILDRPEPEENLHETVRRLEERVATIERFLTREDRL